jgi:predicted branched-subunit amino acid permease
MKSSTIMKWITGVCEALLGIPFLGGLFVLANGWAPLLFMGVVHLITLLLSVRDNENKYGSIFGIITSIVALIPVVGMVMHIISALVLFVAAIRSRRKTQVM